MPKVPPADTVNAEEFTAILRVKALKERGQTDFDLTTPAAFRRQTAEDLNLIDIRKLKFSGQIIRLNQADWQLTAKLGATVVQACVITGAPVTNRFDVPVLRVFLKDFRLADTPGETRFDGDDEAEPLTEVIDLAAIMCESLALALPDYTRAPGAELGESVFTAPGQAPLRDGDVKPFAALAALRDKSGE